MGLRIERIPTLGDNYTYLLVCEATGEAAVVDAPEADPVLRRAEALGARVTKILSTHHHADHSAANPELAKRFDAPVFGHASDSGRLPGQTDGLEEGDTVAVGRETARVLFIPAHTRGHIAYVFDAAGAVFCGDTLFAAGCGRLFEGTPEMMFTRAARQARGAAGLGARLLRPRVHREQPALRGARRPRELRGAREAGARARDPRAQGGRLARRAAPAR